MQPCPNSCRVYSLATLLLFASVFLSIGVSRVQGHGRLVEPPSRASAWRYGFPTEKDYNDAESYCGGWSRQHQRNGGKCGVCGDAWDLPQPRAHENGGRYGQGLIVRTYKAGAVVEIGVELTANHQGYFEFRLCEQNLAKGPETDECFDRHLLRRVDAGTDGVEGHRYYPGSGSGIVFRSVYKLPEGLTCVQCVLQWRYVAGNNWGNCPNGTGAVGCGPQEQFRGCADVRITLDGVPDATPTNATSSATTTPKPRTRGTVTSRYSRPTTTTTEPSTTVNATTWMTEKPVQNDTFEHDNSISSSYGAHPYPYAGVIIALATFVFAVAVVGGTIVYFYRFHEKVATLARHQWRVMRRRVDPTEHKAPLKLPASVFAQHTPQLELAVDGDGKPPVPPRIKRCDLRQLSISISEPLDVTINGVQVARDESPCSTPGEEANVSTA